MIVICEGCGKEYQIDVGRIKGKQARFNCRGCGLAVAVIKPADKPPPLQVDAEPVPQAPSPGSGPGDASPAEDAEKDEKKAASPRRLGLRTKMIFLFFLLPILCTAAAGRLYIQQLNGLSTFMTDQSTGVVNSMAEDLIALKARTVAKQVAIYLEANPDLQKEDFDTHPEFREIAVQLVGETGYTAIYTIPDEQGVSSPWAHPNERLIGVDLKKTMEEALGKGFARFWRVYSGVFGGEPSEGYYPWQDIDGEIREKFMVCLPIENTPYVVASTTYLYEFTMPMIQLQERAGELTKRTINTVSFIVVATILVIGTIVALFGHRLTRRIQSLTDVAERISIGELDADVDVKSKDEIGDLADAVSRMQESIRLSIERLRNRR